jgi:hypothetical protein
MKRKVFGRLKNIEVGKALFTFELTKEGLKVRQRNSRTVKQLGFDRLTNGGGLEVLVGDKPIKFSLSSLGLHLQNGKKEKVLSYELLSNAARDQMELFI